MKPKVCFCGGDSFHVYQKSKWYTLVCCACDCVRRIYTPEVAVDRYEVSVPFKEENKDD